MLPGHATATSTASFFVNSFCATLPAAGVFFVYALVILNGSEGTNKKYTPCQQHTNKNMRQKKKQPTCVYIMHVIGSLRIFLHLIIRLRRQCKKNPITALCKAGATSQRHTHRFPKRYALHESHYALSLRSVKGIAYRQ